MMIYSMFIPRMAAPAIDIQSAPEPIVKGKGQIRAAKPKASGAAQLKRAAKKRSNIRKHG